MNKIVGVIFPIPQHLVNRLLLENRNVFVKYIPRVTGLRITPNHKVLFYASHASKEIVGEGKIEEILFLTPKEALERYGNKLFLNENELTEYMLRQPKRDSSRKMLVLVQTQKVLKTEKVQKTNQYGRSVSDTRRIHRTSGLTGNHVFGARTRLCPSQRVNQTSRVNAIISHC